MKENLKNNLPLAELSKRLGTIVTNVPLEIDFGKMERKEIDWAKVVPLFQKLEFERLVKKYSGVITELQTENVIEKKREAIAKFDFRSVKTEKELDELIARAE